MFLPGNSTIYCGAKHGAVQLTTDNGVSWLPGSGIGSYWHWLTSFVNKGSYIFASADGGGENAIGRTPILYIEWHLKTNGITKKDIRRLVSGTGSSLLAGSFGGGVYRTTNDGELWTNSSNGLDNLFIHSLVTRSNMMYASTVNGVYRSSTNGDLWSFASNGIIATHISSFAISPTTVFAASWGNGVYRSQNNGENWFSINTGLPTAYIPLLDLVSSNQLYTAIDSSYLFRSTNSGDSWSQVFRFEFPGINIEAIAHFSDGTLFVGTTNWGMFRSSDFGSNWEEINTGLSDMNVRCIFITSDNKLFIGTRNGGV
ncbi:MAG: two-component regulator propeller domain-containing protein, partial [Bacteroidota bacterium]